MNPSRLLMLGLVLLLSGSVFGAEYDYVNVRDSGENSHRNPASLFEIAGDMLNEKGDETTNDAPGVADDDIVSEDAEKKKKKENFHNIVTNLIMTAIFVLFFCFVASHAKGIAKLVLKVVLVVGFFLFLAYQLRWISLDQFKAGAASVGENAGQYTDGNYIEAPLRTMVKNVRGVVESHAKPYTGIIYDTLTQTE
eukprot:563442_1